ncbi:MAG TPA: FecR domain-containing protein, partial [Thermoanaerobaculia bacterium]|nr:FecR domain-containing protein [Thermoanaerobaculia bacterium]
MNVKRIGLLAGVLILVAVGTVRGEPARRSGYSYIRELSGDLTVESRWNGSVEGRRNMPISSGDEIVTGERGRAEVSLADGSVLHVAGGTRVRFVRLRDQQGEDDEFSAVDLKSGSIVLNAAKSDNAAAPRVDTDAATIYLSQGARARVNADPRHGTVVIARTGSAEVRTLAGSFTVKAGSYLSVEGEDEPEIARGSFSRDRFDIWSADRFDVAADAHSAASRYVDEGYESDVVALNGYGDWSYNSTYASDVWSPRVAPGWTPYSNGSWYYTPAGLTW